LFTLIKEENHPATGIPLDVHENEDEVFKVIAEIFGRYGINFIS